MMDALSKLFEFLATNSFAFLALLFFGEGLVRGVWRGLKWCALTAKRGASAIVSAVARRTRTQPRAKARTPRPSYDHYPIRQRVP